MKRNFTLPKERKYFLVPVMPTPNGRIHLGHMAGPYLKMDVLKRKVQRNNGIAFLCSGSDAYESYVELKADQLKTTTNDVANHFHDLIVKDFEAMNIKFDLFLNPMQTNLAQEFSRVYQDLLNELVSIGACIEREERFYYDDQNKRFLTGCWLNGKCQNCGSDAGSYFCENCGHHFKPQDIFSNERYPNATENVAPTLYLKLNKELLLKEAERIQNGRFKLILERYFSLQGPYVRLSTKQKTGIECINKTIKDQVIFTYTGLLFFSIFCGEVFKSEFAAERNPFDIDSDFVTCASFGIDNIIPFLTGVREGAVVLKNYKPYDGYLVNFFYHLDGQKFSTSRLHTIWGRDIVEVSKIQPDAVRYFLCKVNPEFEVNNFDSNLFIETVNKDLYREVNDEVQTALSYLTQGHSYDLDDQLFLKIENSIAYQDKFLEVDNFNLSGFIDPINDGVLFFKKMSDTEKRAKSYWWLKAFSYLAYPVMPNFSKSIWSLLDVDSEITSDNFFRNNTMVGRKEKIDFFKKIEFSDLAKSLPQNVLTK
ncbi:MAG: class I tRNA ligase family protein [Cyclobacteriaceae bacterium]|jgi:methionyl-tRNA synthetase